MKLQFFFFLDTNSNKYIEAYKSQTLGKKSS